jgi:hypothetical protein
MKFEDKTVGIYYPPELQLKSEIETYVRNGGGFPRFRTNKGFRSEFSQLEIFDMVVVIDGFSDVEITKAYEDRGIVVVKYGAESKQEKVEEKVTGTIDSAQDATGTVKRARGSKKTGFSRGV